MEFLQQRFYFHEIIKESETTKHYIVEDLDLPSINEQQDSFYYLK